MRGVYVLIKHSSSLKEKLTFGHMAEVKGEHYYIPLQHNCLVHLDRVLDMVGHDLDSIWLAEARLEASNLLHAQYLEIVKQLCQL